MTSDPSFGDEPDTAPQAAVELPMSERARGRAAGDVSTVLLVRLVLAGVAGLALLVLAVLMFAHAVRADRFPPYLTGTDHTIIDRYSAPWIAGAAGATLLAAVCLTGFGADLFRRIRLQRARADRVGTFAGR